MRETGFEATTLKISVRDNEQLSFERQVKKLSRPTNLVAELVPSAMALFKKHYRWHKPIRSLGIRGADLVSEGSVYQISMFDDEKRRISGSIWSAARTGYGADTDITAFSASCSWART